MGDKIADDLTFTESMQAKKPNLVRKDTVQKDLLQHAVSSHHTHEVREAILSRGKWVENGGLQEAGQRKRVW